MFKTQVACPAMDPGKRGAFVGQPSPFRSRQRATCSWWWKGKSLGTSILSLEPKSPQRLTAVSQVHTDRAPQAFLFISGMVQIVYARYRLGVKIVPKAARGEPLAARAFRRNAKMASNILAARTASASSVRSLSLHCWYS